MMMQQLNKILEERLWKHKKIIVAVSGGVDSMVLASVLKEFHVDIAIAHCNFGLRGADSDGDEALVRSWAAEKGIEFYMKRFDTSGVLETQGGNLQETARNLRYGWFETLRQEIKFDLIATAHHKQDSVEKMLINFFKGTGIAGMHGILPQQQHIIRPFLSFTKEEIKAYATEHHIPWREDSSNAKDHYTRNAIRHQLLPIVESLFPNALQNLAGNTRRFAETELLYRETVERHTKKLIEQRGKDWYIPVLKLKKLKPVLSTLLWEILHPFAFSPAQLQDIVGLLDAETGKHVASETYKIIRNRDFLIITPNITTESTHILINKEDTAITAAAFSLMIKEADFTASELDTIKTLQSSELYVDVEKLTFPLILRPKKTGDYFYPLGVHAKKKKVSKYLIEQKVPLHEKEQVWILESDKKIVWVVGRRADDRFKVKDSTKRTLHIKMR